jgi:hypothetical protein
MRLEGGSPMETVLSTRTTHTVEMGIAMRGKTAAAALAIVVWRKSPILLQWVRVVNNSTNTPLQLHMTSEFKMAPRAS